MTCCWRTGERLRVDEAAFANADQEANMAEEVGAEEGAIDLGET